MKKDELQSLLRERGMSDQGIKSELMERLIKDDTDVTTGYLSWSLKKLKQTAKQRGLLDSGTKQELVERLTSMDSKNPFADKGPVQNPLMKEKYHNMKVDELKSLLRGLGMSDKGKKQELVDRLNAKDLNAAELADAIKKYIEKVNEPSIDHDVNQQDADEENQKDK